MATKQKQRGKRSAKIAPGKPSTVRAQNEVLERELKALREENRQLKRSLGALMCKDLPINMDLAPEDGVNESSLTMIIAELERAGK